MSKGVSKNNRDKLYQAKSLPLTICVTADSRCSVAFQHDRLRTSGSTVRSALSSNDHVIKADQQPVLINSRTETFFTKLENWITNGGPNERAICFVSFTDALGRKLELLSTPLSGCSYDGWKQRDLSPSWLRISGSPRSLVTAAI